MTLLMGNFKEEFDKALAKEIAPILADISDSIEVWLTRKDPISPEEFVMALKIAIKAEVYPSYDELAKEVRVSRSALSKWMNGKAMTTPPARKAIVTTISEGLKAKLQEFNC